MGGRAWNLFIVREEGAARARVTHACPSQTARGENSSCMASAHFSCRLSPCLSPLAAVFRCRGLGVSSSCLQCHAFCVMKVCLKRLLNKINKGKGSNRLMMVEAVKGGAQPFPPRPPSSPLFAFSSSIAMYGSVRYQDMSMCLYL